MKFEAIRSIVGAVPIMTPEQGKVLYDFILATGRENILELGFAHGTSACYMAAALEELGRGSIVTIDNRSAEKREPNIHELLRRAALERYVMPIYSDTSYTWELKHILERQIKNGQIEPCFDLCFVDGAHAWEPDGLAFFIAEMLMKPGGWFVFDDLDWTYASSAALRDTEWVRGMPHDFKSEPHVDRIFRLLVANHPNMTNLRREGNWGWAQKHTDAPDTSTSNLDAIYSDQSIITDAKKLAKRLLKKVVRR